jgi:hypothetical protein
MPSAANPISDLNLYTPQPGDPHSQAHPIVVLPPNLSPGFTLVVSASGNYELSFSNGMAPSTNNGNSTARVYIVAFSYAFTSPVWWHTLHSPPNVGRGLTIETARFSPAQIFGATQMLIGSWWDDGSYPDSWDGVLSFFTNHPEGGGHHTVTIIPG